MIEVIFLALALSMDAFAVSIGLGAKHQFKRKKLALLVAVYFGVFQGLMPVIGYLVGFSLLHWINTYANWIAFILLFVIGAKMVFESFSSGIEQSLKNINHKVLLLLAIATSIDALAAGFALNVLTLNAYIAGVIIAIITAVASSIGVYIGAKTGTKFEHSAELLGGLVLILIGFKLLIF